MLRFMRVSASVDGEAGVSANQPFKLTGPGDQSPRRSQMRRGIMITERHGTDERKWCGPVLLVSGDTDLESGIIVTMVGKRDRHRPVLWAA